MTLPPGVSRNPDQATSWWAALGYCPLLPIVEFDTNHGPTYLAGPGTCDEHLRPSLPDRDAIPFLRRRGREKRSLRILLLSRTQPSHFFPIAQATDIAINQAAVWLGWPDLARASDSKWPNTISEWLSIRSNDYWILDLAAEVLGLGSLNYDALPAYPSSPCLGVSIVVPARGVCNVLGGVLTAIESAAKHLPPSVNWECLVIDDANSPSLSLALDLPPNIRLLRSPKQLYCGGARNMGLAKARYELVVFCDADIHLASTYLAEHYVRHLLGERLVTVSMREYIGDGETVPDRVPLTDRDSRILARYNPGRMGLIPVLKPIEVNALTETNHFRTFGYGRTLGPVDLPFMVKGNNLVVSTNLARSVGGFPPDFIGWGPEDVCFAAKTLSHGAFVVPVLSTGVFHLNHPPRSGSLDQQHAELAANLTRYARHLANSSPTDPWDVD